jgi:KDO2-lipid IV(A) lauroyltransferase
MKKSWALNLSQSLSKIVGKLPLSLQFLIGDAIGILWFDILRIRRSVVLANLQLAFPDWTEGQRIKVGRRSLCHLGRSFVEFCRIPGVDQIKDKSQFEIRGVEHLRKAEEKGRGVFLLASHVGNGDWASIGLALNGILINTITKEFKLKALNQFWFETRQRFGMGLIPDRKSSLMILKLLKQNKIVVFVMDQFLGPPIGTKTHFFGVETGAPMGLALLAERSGASVVPVLTHREPNGITIVEFEPEIPFVDLQEKDQNITVNTQKYSDKIEQWVRRFPEQWMWVHRRWKVFR